MKEKWRQRKRERQRELYHTSPERKAAVKAAAMRYYARWKEDELFRQNRVYSSRLRRMKRKNDVLRP